MAFVPELVVVTAPVLVMTRGLSAVVRVNGPVALLIVVAIFLSATKLLVAETSSRVERLGRRKSGGEETSPPSDYSWVTQMERLLLLRARPLDRLQP